MPEVLIVIGRAVAPALRGHRELALENVALRQQLMAMNRAVGRQHLQARDRLLWIALRRLWTNWRTALVIVRPDTVVGWHRDWLRRRWTRRSRRRTSGRPPVSPEGLTRRQRVLRARRRRLSFFADRDYPKHFGSTIR